MIHNQKETGFTIIELLVVVAIIGVLTSLGLAFLSQAQEKGRDSRRFEDLQQIKNALELYSADQSGLFPSGNSMSILKTGEYIAAIPFDPLGTGIYGYSYQGTDLSGNICNSGQCTSYVLRAVLEVPDQEALSVDRDGIIGGLDCTDPAFCFTP